MRLLEKEQRLKLAAQKKAEQLAKGATRPIDLFKTSEFSEWDESVSLFI